MSTILKNLPLILTIWAVSTAVLSVLNAKVIKPNFPKAGAVIASIVAISPGDIHKLWDELSTLFPKDVPAPPAAPKADPPAPPPAA